MNTDDLAKKAEGLETGTVPELKADDLKKYDAPSQNNDFGKFYGFNLRLYNMTCLNVYFRPEDNYYDIDDFTFKVKGKEETIEKFGEYYRLACDDIRAYQLDDEMTFEATYEDETLTYKCSAMSYCYSVLMQPKDDVYTDALKELCANIS